GGADAAHARQTAAARMNALDPTLQKVIALWRDIEHDGERQAARAKAERLAKQAGMTFEQAVSAEERERNGGRPLPISSRASMIFARLGSRATKPSRR